MLLPNGTLSKAYRVVMIDCQNASFYADRRSNDVYRRKLYFQFVTSFNYYMLQNEMAHIRNDS